MPPTNPMKEELCKGCNYEKEYNEPWKFHNCGKDEPPKEVMGDWRKELTELLEQYPKEMGETGTIEEWLIGFVQKTIDQAKEAERARIEKIIEGMKKKQTKHFARGIEVQHHKGNSCTDECIPNGKNQGGEFNQALEALKSKINE